LRVKLTGAVSGGAVSGLLALSASTSELVDRVTLTVPVVVANAPEFPATLARNWVTRRGAESFGLVTPER